MGKLRAAFPIKRPINQSFGSDTFYPEPKIESDPNLQAKVAVIRSGLIKEKLQ